MNYVGGFFGVELPPPQGSSVGSFWRMPGDPSLTFSNGRSALAALIASVAPPKIWLPAYVCRSVADAAAAAGVLVDYFPVDAQLEADIGFLDGAAVSGELVLAVDYFGRPPGEAFRSWVVRRTDLQFVEDACHAIDTGAPPWGTWCLRSPRKLVGVADGGFVVPPHGIAQARRSTMPADASLWQAAFLRFEDDCNLDNETWHRLNQRREAEDAISSRRMTRMSRELLARIPLEPLTRLRRANFAVLAGLPEAIRFTPDSVPGFVPMGFPVRLPRGVRDRVRSALIGQGFFPAVHWQDLPSPGRFTVAHTLADELLTLPCDHRYSPGDMERLARAVIESLGPQ